MHLAIVTAPALLGRGAQFAVLAWLALLVTPADYGRFASLQVLVLGVASITASTMGASANASTARAVRNGVESFPVLVLMLLRARRRALLGNLLVSAVAVPVGARLVVGNQDGALPVLVLTGVMSAALPLGEMVVAVLAGSGRYRTASWVDAGRAVAGATLALLLGTTAGPWWAVVGLLAVDAVVAVLLLGLAASRSWTAGVELQEDVSGSIAAREGLAAGLTANLLGQAANWSVLWAIGILGGPVGLGVYGVALRFASVVTLAPQYFGKTVIGQLAAPDPGRNHWTPRSFVGMLAVLSVVGSGAAAVVLVTAFPGLVARYDGLWGTLAVVLTAASLRAVLIGLGQVCVARRLWRTWVVADGVSFVVTVVGVLLVVVGTAGDTGTAGVVAVVLVTVVANLAGITARLVGVVRRLQAPEPVA
ncbi:hypothetical protein [Curtobacterium oceanosedimentum]|uniref:hypothetical protein n=1 Tax=Curtobacterium oceanosedimentum TaxID=465820 RepID=UPI001CE1E068|nr:hypothetical protein [Curtobacterium oceanosedimentum]MCA5922365.1 hypothetical protein [Curtobacterium oceanosedimentum]